MEDLHIYRNILQECQKYHNETIGLTNYKGIQGSDKTYPQILNFQTILLLKLYQRIETIEEKISILDQKQLGNIKQADLIELKNHIATGKEIIPYHPRISYKTW